MSAPFEHHRRLVLELTVEADDIDELAERLRGFALDLEIQASGPGVGFSGGYRSSQRYVLKIDPEMTGERYRELLSEWDKERRASAHDG